MHASKGEIGASRQSVDLLHGYHHITTLLQRKKEHVSDEIICEYYPADNGTLHITSNPLYKQCHGLSSQVNPASAVWRDYLVMQRKSLLRKRRGLDISARKRDNFPNEAELATLEKQRKAIPDFDLDEVIRLLDEHIESME